MFQEKRSQVAVATLSAVAGLGALAMPSSNAEGAALKNMSQYNDSLALAQDPMYKWAGAIKREDSVGISVASAIAIAPDLYINAGHYTPRDGSTAAFHRELIFGANYNTSTDRYTVSHTQRYPGFVFGDTGTVDLGVGWTSSFISGFTTPTQFGNVPLGEIGSQADYGNIGDGTTGEMPSLGDKMAGYAPRITDSTNQYPESKYDFFDFNGIDSNSIALNVQGLNYSSGSPWYDSQGNLSGLLIAKTNGIGIGESIVLDLTTPEVQAYLQPLIQDSWDRYYASIPEPTSLAVLGVAAVVGLQRRRQS